MLATIASAALQEIDAEIVHVEVNAGEAGEPKLILVGLPDARGEGIGQPSVFGLQQQWVSAAEDAHDDQSRAGQSAQGGSVL